MSEWIIFAAIQVVSLMMVGVFIYKDYKAQHPPKPPLCDSCRWLTRKRVPGVIDWEYQCEIHGCFNGAPEICKAHQLKEGADHE